MCNLCRFWNMYAYKGAKEFYVAFYDINGLNGSMR